MNRYNVLITILSALCSLLPALLYSQSVDTAWVRTYNGPANGVDGGRAIAVDEQGNVYVTGISIGSGTYMDYATVKYNSAGVEQWARRYNGPGNAWDWVKAIAVDGQGNVYVTGGVAAGGYDDYGTIKYNSNGDTLWVRRYNGPGNAGDGASALAVDGQGNVYVTGGSSGSGTSLDYATIKYNSAGDTLWVRRYNGPGNGSDWTYSLAVDGQGNVYVTGESYGSGGSDDYVTIKYNSAGVEQWTQRYNGPGNDDDWAHVIAVDGQSNVYVTGYSVGSGSYADYATIKYNANGDTLWVRRYNGPGNSDDEDNSLAVDGQGNVYVTGESYGSGTAYDYATIKYNSAGVQEWVQRYNGPGNGDDWAYSLAVDGSGNVYVTGYSIGTSPDYATIKYNSSGVQQWVQRYNGPGNDDDEASALAVDDSGNVYVTGYSAVSSTNADFATIKYVQTQGIEEIASLPLAKTSGVEVYPNPVKSFFVVRIPSSIKRQTLKMFDVSGKLVKEIDSPSAHNDKVAEMRVSLKGIKPGVYFVQVGDEMVKEKLVVTK
jgi:uncharacterized delta-60 repeat protein